MLVARNEALVGLAADAMGAGQEFHRVIAEISQNRWATRLLAQIEGQMARYRRFTNETQGRRDAALAEHRGILDAIAAGDVEASRERAEAHVLAARDVALATIAPQLDPP